MKNASAQSFPIKPILKSVCFVCGVHLLSAVNMILYGKNILSDTLSLIYLVLLSIAIIPTYFFVKRNDGWQYSLCVILSHIAFTFLACMILRHVLSGWDTVILYWTIIFISSAFALSAAADLVFRIFKHARKSRKPCYERRQHHDGGRAV